jgi:hypothetical protein
VSFIEGTEIVLWLNDQCSQELKRKNWNPKRHVRSVMGTGTGDGRYIINNKTSIENAVTLFTI